MPHDTTLIATIAAGLGLAFVLGFVAIRLRLPPLVGYLIAGVVVGPYTPGIVVDTGLASQLAEIGVILLMFGVGLHFSIGDLLGVRRIAIPGALAQFAVATPLAMAAAHLWGWTWGEGFVFGLTLSVASTVVTLRVMEERGALDTMNGRTAVGWLIVQDVAMVLALVLLPAVAGSLGGTPPARAGLGPDDSLVVTIAVTLAKVAAFVLLMLYVGTRAVPWLLARVARTGSRELFTLAVLAVALGVAVGAAALFGVSFALGAFFAGVVIVESDLSHQAAAEALPLQDAFAVLFFVSVGMLFDPTIVLREPARVFATLLIIVIGKSLASAAILLLFRHPVGSALTISASLAQIGEFSFILAGLGVSLRVLPPEGQSLVLAGALLSIMFNPLAFAGARRLDEWLRGRPRLLGTLERRAPELADAVGEAVPLFHDHAVIVGHGRVGGTIGEALERREIPYVVVERDRQVVEALRARGIHAHFGDATRPGILSHAHLEHARLLVVATPEPYQGRRIVELARDLNPGIRTLVRTHSAAEQAYFESVGVNRAMMGERELALGMAHFALTSLGLHDDAADVTVAELRRQHRAARAEDLPLADQEAPAAEGPAAAPAAPESPAHPPAS